MMASVDTKAVADSKVLAATKSSFDTKVSADMSHEGLGIENIETWQTRIGGHEWIDVNIYNLPVTTYSQAV